MHAAPTRQIRTRLPARPPKSAPFKQWIPWLIAAGIAVIMLLAMCVGLLALLMLSGDKIPAGVAVAGIPLGGQSREEALQTLQNANLNLSIILTDGERHWGRSLAELGVSADLASTLDAASQSGRNQDITPWYTVDLNITQQALLTLSQEANVAAVPGNPPQMGRALDIPVILSRLYVDVRGELADGKLELNMVQVVPPPLESVNFSPEVSTIHVVEAGQELGLIAKAYGVSIDDILKYNDLPDPNILLIGQELVIPAAGLYEPSPEQAPPAPTQHGKSILVSTGEQRIYAYENGVMVHSHLVSTGLPATPTVIGTFSIYVKYRTDDMEGPDYYLPNVPYTMYFFEGYGIHGTYWHNNFGRPMSHGCVNLPTDEAGWFFEWAEVGTPVQVI